MDIKGFIQDFMASEAVQKTADEIQAIDPTDAIKHSYILEQVIEEKKKELKSLDDETKASPWRMFRRYMEYFRMYYVYIGMVHPLFSAGRDRIEEWRAAVDEYEKLFDGYFPYVSLVTESMFPKVRHLIPADLLELSGDPDRYIIAAYQVMLPEGDGGVEDYPLEVAGVMSFSLRDMDDEVVVCIDWIRSDREHADANAMDALMAEMFYMIKDTPVSGIVFDMSFEETLDIDYDGEGDEQLAMSPLSSLMERWYFEASLIPDEELITDAGSLKKLLDIDPEGDSKVRIEFIDKMTDEEFADITRRYIEEEPGVYDNGIPFAGRRRYDKKMSCFAKKNGAIVGILLVHKNHRNEYYVDMARGDSDGITMEMIMTAIEEISGRISDDQQVIIPVKREFVADFTAQYLPDARPTVMIRSTLLAPDPEEDIDSDEWAEFAENIDKIMPDIKDEVD